MPVGDEGPILHTTTNRTIANRLAANGSAVIHGGRPIQELDWLCENRRTPLNEVPAEVAEDVLRGRLLALNGERAAGA